MCKHVKSTANTWANCKICITEKIKAKALYMLHGEKIVKALEIIQDIIC